MILSKKVDIMVLISRFYGIFGDYRVRGRENMVTDINEFIHYLREVKRTSRNTEISYQRDLMQLASFLEKQGITEVGKVTKTSLNSYILFFGEGRQGVHYNFPYFGIYKGFFSL